MSYHNTSTSEAQSITNTQRQIAPDGYHYMPDGTLMLDTDHGKLTTNNVLTSFNMDLNDISAGGESRTFVIRGGNKTEFSLEVKNEDGHYYNFQTNLFQVIKTRLSKVGTTGGQHTGFIDFPLVTDADQYDFSLFAEEGTYHNEYRQVRFADGSIDINSSTGSNSNLVQKTIYQTLDTTATIQSYSPNGDITGTNTTSATITGTRNKNITNVSFTHVFTVTSTRTLRMDKQPTSDDVMVFVTRTIGDPVDIPGEDIYPAVIFDDTVNGAVASGAIVELDANVASNVVIGDKITTTATTDTVNGAVTSGVNVIMDAAVATKMAVGYQVTTPEGQHVLDSKVVTVAAINVGSDANTFALSEAIALSDGETLRFHNKVNRDLTTVLSLDPGGEAKQFTMSQDINFHDNCAIFFSNRRNYRWSINNIDGLKDGMRVRADAATNGFTDTVTIKEYLDETTIFEGEINEQKLLNLKVSPLDTLSVKPTLTRNASTKVKTIVQTGNISFSEQALYIAKDNSQKIFSYGISEINRLTGYDIEFSDLKAELTEVTTTTTASTIGAASTSVAIANRAGIMDGISTVSGIGIDPAAANPTVSSGAGSVTGAGTIVLSAAQELENGVTLTFPGVGTIVTITGNAKINKVGNEDVTLRFDLDKFLTKL